MRNILAVEGTPLEARTSQLSRRLVEIGKYRTYISRLTVRAQSRSAMSLRASSLEGELVDVVGEETAREGAVVLGKLRFAFEQILKDTEGRPGIEDIVTEFRSLPQALDAQFLVAQKAAKQGEIASWKEPTSGSTYPGGRLEFELEQLQSIGERALQLTKRAAKILTPRMSPNDDDDDD